MLFRSQVKGYIDGELACELETVVLIPDVFDQFKPKRKEKDERGDKDGKL